MRITSETDQQAPALLYNKVVRRPALEDTQHHRPTQPPTKQ